MKRNQLNSESGLHFNSGEGGYVSHWDRRMSVERGVISSRTLTLISDVILRWCIWQMKWQALERERRQWRLMKTGGRVMIGCTKSIVEGLSSLIHSLWVCLFFYALYIVRRWVWEWKRAAIWTMAKGRVLVAYYCCTCMWAVLIP